MLDQLLDSDPGNEELLGDQAITFLWTATTCIEMKHWDETLDTANGAVAVFSKLAENNSTDGRIRFHLALALQRRAIAMAEIGASIRATASALGTSVLPPRQVMSDAETSRRILRDLVAKDPANTAWANGLAVAELLHERLSPRGRRDAKSSR